MKTIPGRGKCMCKGPGAPKQYGTQLPRELFQMVVNKEAGTESYSSREHGKPVYHEALGYNAILKHSFLFRCGEWIAVLKNRRKDLL